MKDLSKMPLEELWKLFPIKLLPHDPKYKEYYEAEKAAILAVAGEENVSRINHIGSSAVDGLLCKPTVDILLEYSNAADHSKMAERLRESGWQLMSSEKNPAQYAMNKGYTPDGFADKVFHLHIRPRKDHGELYFRDYLIDHPETALEYAELKRGLLSRFEYDRDGYTEAKTEFIETITAKARKEYGAKY